MRSDIDTCRAGQSNLNTSRDFTNKIHVQTVPFGVTFFVYSFKAQSSKLKTRKSLFTEMSQKRFASFLSFEL